MPVQVVSTTSASVGASSTRTSLPTAGGNVLYVYVAASATTTVFVKFGTVTTDAVTTDFAVPPGSTHVLFIPVGSTHIAHIGSGVGPSTLYMARGFWQA